MSVTPQPHFPVEGGVRSSWQPLLIAILMLRRRRQDQASGSAAVDDTGKGGAVDAGKVSTDLTPAVPMKLGGIMLVAPRGASFFPADAFSTEEGDSAFTSVYGDVSKGLSAKIEWRRHQMVRQSRRRSQEAAGTTEADKFVLNAKLALLQTAPGDYVVRAIIRCLTSRKAESCARCAKWRSNARRPSTKPTVRPDIAFDVIVDESPEGGGEFVIRSRSVVTCWPSTYTGQFGDSPVPGSEIRCSRPSTYRAVHHASHHRD